MQEFPLLCSARTQTSFAYVEPNFTLFAIGILLLPLGLLLSRPYKDSFAATSFGEPQ